MKKKTRTFVIIFLWLFVLYILYDKGLLTFDVKHIQQVIEQNEKYAMIMFVLLFSIRVFLFLPGLPFMVMGGVLFGCVKGFCLSMIGIAISLSFVYLFSFLFSESKWVEKIKKKHSSLLPIVERYNHKFLAVGILAPIANTDIVCLLSTLTGITYRKYILTAMLVNVPTVFLYSLIGNSYNTSMSGMITVAIFSVFNFGLGFYILWKIKKDMKKHKEEN